MTDIQNHKTVSFVEYVRQSSKKEDSKSTNEYAFKSFLNIMSNRLIERLTKAEVTCWIATMLMSGKSANTVKRYICRLHVTYLDWQKENTRQYSDTIVTDSIQDPFDGLLTLIVPENQVKIEDVQSNLNRIKKLVTTDIYQGEIGKWKAIFFYLLYNPELSMDDIVNLKFDNASKYCPQTVEILESMDSSHGRKYVFDLKQPDKRVSGIVREVNINVHRLLKSVGMKFLDGYTSECIKSMWICAAFRASVSVSEIKSIVRVIPKEYKILEAVEPTQLSEKDKYDIICRVANSINDITTRWYVLNMRDKNEPDNVKSFIKELFPALYDKMHFFYPTHIIFNENRRKKLVRQVMPFLPGLLFIKLRSDMVNTIMSKITTVAWGYKYNNTPGSSYSAISQKAMTDFQRHIGVFSDDVKVELVKTVKQLEEGQKVRILRSDLFGRFGEIESVKNVNGALYYTIQITEDTAVRITVQNLDVMFVESAV